MVTRETLDTTIKFGPYFCGGSLGLLFPAAANKLSANVITTNR
jgi:hypothetical protein